MKAVRQDQMLVVPRETWNLCKSGWCDYRVECVCMYVCACVYMSRFMPTIVHCRLVCEGFDVEELKWFPQK